MVRPRVLTKWIARRPLSSAHRRSRRKLSQSCPHYVLSSAKLGTTIFKYSTTMRSVSNAYTRWRNTLTRLACSVNTISSTMRCPDCLCCPSPKRWTTILMRGGSWNTSRSPTSSRRINLSRNAKPVSTSQCRSCLSQSTCPTKILRSAIRRKNQRIRRRR